MDRAATDAIDTGAARTTVRMKSFSYFLPRMRVRRILRSRDFA